MLERLHFVFRGCVGEGTQNSDRIVALNKMLLRLESGTFRERITERVCRSL